MIYVINITHQAFHIYLFIFTGNLHVIFSIVIIYCNLVEEMFNIILVNDILCIHIQVAYMTKIRKEYTTNPEFDPTKVAKASSAAEGLCKWVLAMEIYDRVVRVVAPKKVKLAQAEADLAATMEQLDKKRVELKEIEDRLAALQETFQNMVEEKDKLEFQVISAIFVAKSSAVQCLV